MGVRPLCHATQPTQKKHKQLHKQHKLKQPMFRSTT